MINEFAIPARRRLRLGGWLFAFAFFLNCLTFSPDSEPTFPPGIFGALLAAAVLAQVLLYPVCCILLGWGFYLSAIAKGHSPWLAAVGILPLVGWVVVWILPDNRKEVDRPGFSVILRR